MKFSIITTAYKTAQYIEEYILSVRDQIRTTRAIEIRNGKKMIKLPPEPIEFELLLGIDGCLATLNKVKEIQQKYRFEWLVVYWSAKNVGTYVLRNTLATLSTTKHLVFFDSDDIMTPFYLQRVYEESRKSMSLVVYYFGHGFNGKFVKDSKNFKLQPSGHGTFYCRKSIFMHIGGFKSWRCAADTDFLQRVKATRSRISFHRHVLYYRRMNPTSLTNCREFGMNSAIRKSYNRHMFNARRDPTPIIKMVKTEVEAIQIQLKDTTKPQIT